MCLPEHPMTLSAVQKHPCTYGLLINVWIAAGPVSAANGWRAAQRPWRRRTRSADGHFAAALVLAVIRTGLRVSYPAA